jgi:glycosyltransferase involved in cell wall biosynthesis
VYALSPTDGPHAGALRARGVPVTIFARRSSADLARLCALARALAADRVDVVHGFLDAANAYAFLAGRMLRKPTVLSLRNELLMVVGMRAAALRAMLRRADAVVANSGAGKRFLVDTVGADGERVFHVPNIVEPCTAAPERRTGPPLVGCVGRLVDQKRFDAALRAFPRVRAAVPEARLEIVGDGPNRDALLAAARTLGVEDAVSFVGAVDDAASRMARMSCLVIPSAFEGLANTALEALSLGVPVVAAPVGDLATVVIEGRTGILVSDVSPQPLADAVVRAVTDAELQARARTEGPRLVEARFSVAAALGVLVPLYLLLGKRTGAAASEATTPVLGE